MSDLIGKGELIEDLRDSYVRGFENGYKQGLMEATRWIPCSERLPETSDPVLVTYIFNGNRREVATANYYNEAWFPYDCEFYYELVDVLAWMPLPESFKGGG